VAYPSDANRLLAAGYIQSGSNTYMGIFFSTNGGTNWTQVKIMNENGSEADAVALAPSNVNTIYVAGHRYPSWDPVFFRSANGGAAWTQVASPCSSSQVYGLAVHPTTPTTLYAVTSWKGVSKSTDGGSSWAQLTNAPNGGNCVALNPSNPNDVFVGHGAGISYSADGGSTWTDLSEGLAAKNVVWIEVDGAARQVYAGIAGGGICRRSF
jgi:photosystem II stability/assembly factor-like uncharacterized protein